MELAPGNNFVCAFSNGQVTLIDVSGKAAPVQQKVSSGKVISVRMDESNRRILVLTTNSFHVWDSGTGKLLATVDGLSKPTLVVVAK